MIRSEKVLDSLVSGSKIISLHGKLGSHCAGLIYLDSDEKIRVNIGLGLDENDWSLHGNSFSGVFDGGAISIQLSGELSSGVGESFHKNPRQKEIQYSYLLLGDIEEYVTERTFNRLIVSFPMFFIDADESGIVGDFEQKGLKCRLHYSRSKKWTAYPDEYRERIDDMWIELQFEDSKEVDELLYYRTIIHQYVASSTGYPLASIETLFMKKRDSAANDRSLKNYATYLDKNMSLPQDNGHPSPERHLLDYKNRKQFTNDFQSYLNSFDAIQPANNIHAAFVRYNTDKVYVDSQLSLLFAGIDSMFKKIYQPDIDEKRTEKYSRFLSTVNSLEDVDKSIKNFIGLDLTRGSYLEATSFTEKIKKVAKYSGITITHKWALNANRLRNQLAHGEIIEWNHYLVNVIDEEGERIERIDPNKIGRILREAIMKYARSSV